MRTSAMRARVAVSTIHLNVNVDIHAIDGSVSAFKPSSLTVPNTRSTVVSIFPILFLLRAFDFFLALLNFPIILLSSLAPCPLT